MLAHRRRHPSQGACRPLRVMTRLGKVAVTIIKQSDHCVRISPAGCIVHGFLACSTVIGTRQEDERNGWTKCMLVFKLACGRRCTCCHFKASCRYSVQSIES
ncbi:uncharacterized protein BO95DRAFT_262344 [Aspergillus brunneoviolaceus CBS 621.78]|uniref:Uncharacterized protein n=1 Tax=Aspergillus brunneoviolaceus CBS 621.78 TaxID=1450534 RepID=A0ACD1FX80_9EURO|nr:hypothetical protein BO95DRAFT_262344 [Aspergillus brunneoviolaceus CBS 621.78]RAH41521.1 hypothetical protein BO95DRAFT_262344 [Aspergillus brunneoviolaceus CBS 621.78]